MEQVKDYNEKDLLLRIAQGDEQAFSEIFDRYSAKIYSVALRITRSQASAEELLQDTFLIVWLRREQLSTIQDFDAYLYIIARNAAYRTLKRIARQQGNIDISSKDGSMDDLLFNDNKTEEDISFRDLNAQLQMAIAKLSPQQKQVYHLIKELGYSREQAAQALGISAETVKTHLDRAMKSIRAFLMADLKLALLALASVQGIRL